MSSVTAQKGTVFLCNLCQLLMCTYMWLNKKEKDGSCSHVSNGYYISTLMY